MFPDLSADCVALGVDGCWRPNYSAAADSSLILPGGLSRQHVGVWEDTVTLEVRAQGHPNLAPEVLTL